MDAAILLTGPPGCGKTTVIQLVLANVGSPAGGFYTQEIREEGARVGFKVVTLDGREGILAHRRIRGGPRVGKYGVDLAVMDGLAVGAIRGAIEGGELIVIDEIGPMELFSQAFQNVVVQTLDAGLPVLGTVMRRSSPFADRIKVRPDVRLVEMQRGAAGEVATMIEGFLREQGIA
jgi:nucleoside-triphosphatase